MLDFLLLMPTTEFLIYFSIISVILIAMGWFWVHADGTKNYPLPDEHQLNTFELAALREGRKGVIHTALFNLWHRGLLTSDRNSAYPKVQRVNVSTSVPHGDIETALYKFTWTARRPIEFFTDAELSRKLDALIRPMNRKLESMHLKVKENYIDRASIAKFVILGILFAIAGAKIYHDLFSNDSFLVILAAMVPPVIITHYLIKPTRNTCLGMLYLHKMRNYFVQLEAKEEVDPAVRVALFGISSLSGVTMFSSFQNAFATTDDIIVESGDYTSYAGGSGCSSSGSG
jgi:uncharacterized protein (TIGR04222 family)